ncbi:hypothetical protein ACF0H5_022924 [Mactra antiquata]
MDLIFRVLAVLGTILTVYSVTTLSAAIEDINVDKILEDSEIDLADIKKNDTTCHLRQTMAWRECLHIDCPVTCQGSEDCTFPYCNIDGQCTCRPVACHTAQSCHFFRIDCAGKFTCQNKNCICQK